jgi:hypothetical protein
VESSSSPLCSPARRTADNQMCQFKLRQSTSPSPATNCNGQGNLRGGELSNGTRVLLSRAQLPHLGSVKDQPKPL